MAKSTKMDEACEGGAMRRPRRKAGGKINVYNAEGSPAVAAAKDEDESFKKGGRPKRAAGGMAEGAASMPRGDQAPRGRLAKGGRAGGSPFSSGRTLTSPKDDKSGRGHENISVPTEPGL